jgi:hypothetical protein
LRYEVKSIPEAERNDTVSGEEFLRDLRLARVKRLMRTQFSKFRMNYFFGLVTALSLAVGIPSAQAQAQGGALKAWSTIQQSVKEMETAVQSKNLHGIHDPSMKIRAPIRTLKAHSSMLGDEQRQKLAAELKQLDNSVTDLHSAADAGDQAQAETALKKAEGAFEQLKAENPESLFKGM